jgi:hypothetical protein
MRKQKNNKNNSKILLSHPAGNPSIACFPLDKMATFPILRDVFCQNINLKMSIYQENAYEK